MNLTEKLQRSRTCRIAVVALVVLAADQLTKAAVLRYLGYMEDRVVIEGFFKFVHWTNTGAAWSLFRDNNALLAIVAVVALIVLFFSRHHFNSRTVLGQVSLGLIFGGITGNLIDRVRVGHVIDFLYFYLNRRGADPIGFPAFNVADTAICVGVGLVFLNTWKADRTEPAPAESPATTPRP